MSCFDWKEFSTVGMHLMEFSDEEAYQRSAVGRFYYACFGVAKNYYETTHHKNVPSRDSHKFLINHFNNSQFSEEKEIGKKLHALRRCRNNSDYETKFHKTNLNKSKHISHELLSIIDYLNENPLYEKF